MRILNQRLHSHTIKWATEVHEVWKEIRGDRLQPVAEAAASGGQVLVVEGVVVVLEVVVNRQELNNSSSQHCAFFQKIYSQGRRPRLGVSY